MHSMLSMPDKHGPYGSNPKWFTLGGDGRRVAVWDADEVTQTLPSPVIPEGRDRPPVRRRLPHPALVAGLLITAGGIFRLVMTLLSVPDSDGDESIMGLMATHIAGGRHFPVYFYGQNYMGSIEAILAAPFIALFGPSVVALRVPVLLLCYGAFGAVMYVLTSRLYTRWFAVFVSALIASASYHVLAMQMRASGGYPELAAAGALGMLVAVVLAVGVQAPPRRRLLLFGLWGLAAGFVLWDNWLPLPYVAASAVLLLAFCGRELVGMRGAALVAGGLVGAAPMIYRLLAAPTGRRVLAEPFAVSAGGPPASAIERLRGTVVTGVPLSEGLCGCGPAQSVWGPLLVLLLGVAAVLALAALVRRRPSGTVPDPGDRSRRAVQAGRLALAVAGGLALLLYTQSSRSGSDPVSSSRYLAALPIALPAVLWPLWRLAGPAGTPRRRALAGTAVRGVALALLAALAGSMLIATVGSTRWIPGGQASDRQVRDAVTALDEARVTAVYSDYTTCGRLNFLTRQRISCSVLQDDLHRGKDRYPPSRVAVAAAPRPAYLLQTGSRMQAAFAGWLGARGVRVPGTAAGTYTLYRPPARLPVPAGS